MAAKNWAYLCMMDIVTKLKTVPATGSRTLSVYDQDTFLDVTAETKFPAVGVIYEGMSTKGGQDRTGLATELYCGIIVIVGDKNEEIRGKTNQEEVALLLDDLRSAVKHSKSPTNHAWEFMFEVQLDISHQGMGYYIKWKTTVMLT